MTKERKNEIIFQIIELISEIAYDNVPAADNDDFSFAESAVHPVEMLTIKECKQLVPGLSEHSIRRFIAQGKVKHIRAGEGNRGKILINKDDLIDYLQG